jgi:hypothetical protein
MRKRSVAGTAQDPTIQFAKLEVDGNAYKLAYSFNAIAEAETSAGCNLLGGLENLGSLTALQFRGLLFAALSVAQPKMTIEEVGRLIRLDTKSAIANALAEAYQLSMPEKEQDPPEAEAPGASAAADLAS